MGEAFSLRVMLADAEVGHLRVDAQQQLQFDYMDDRRQTGFPLAPNVPLSPLPDHPVEWRDAAVAYFQNLLPEGRAGRRLPITTDFTFQPLRVAAGNGRRSRRRIEAPPPGGIGT